jgi:hypothetical protein
MSADIFLTVLAHNRRTFYTTGRKRIIVHSEPPVREYPVLLCGTETRTILRRRRVGGRVCRQWGSKDLEYLDENRPFSVKITNVGNGDGEEPQTGANK